MGYVADKLNPRPQYRSATKQQNANPASTRQRNASNEFKDSHLEGKRANAPFNRQAKPQSQLDSKIDYLRTILNQSKK